MSRTVRASIIFNPNPNSKKFIFLFKRRGIEIINYHQKFKLDLPHLGGIDYNLISSRTETYSTLSRQGRL